MGGYNFNVNPVQVENGTDYQARKDSAAARKLELQQRQIELAQAQKAQKLKDTQEAAATSAYRPQTANMGNMQLPGGYGSMPMGSVQGPAQLDRGAYTQGLQKAGYGYEAMQADQGFQKQDADAAMAQVELRKKLADVTTVDLTNHSKALTLTAQLAQPVDALEQQGAPPDVLQKAYNDSLVAGARAGMDVSQLPHVYQKGMARQYMQQAVTAKDIFDNEITLRGQDATAKTAAEGRKVTERGQDLTAATARRGQDMTDKRSRDANAIAEKNRQQKPPSEGERNAFAFYKRASDADTVLKELEPKIAGMGLGGQVGRAVLPNVMQSDDNQVYRQAQRQFTQAKLRRESGAAISQAEYEEDANTYFPKPGDSKPVLERKAKARQAIMSELKVASGRAYTETYGDESDSGGKEIHYKIVNGQLVPE